VTAYISEDLQIEGDCLFLYYTICHWYMYVFPLTSWTVCIHRKSDSHYCSSKN